MNTRYIQFLLFLFGFLLFSNGCTENSSGDKAGNQATRNFLTWDDFSKYITEFNEKDEELYIQHIPNNDAGEFLKDNIPACRRQALCQLIKFNSIVCVLEKWL